ncbi:GNAT family N-acetyltransferase [Glycomyces sp. NPDC047369]
MLIRKARKGDAEPLAVLLGQLGYPRDEAAVTARIAQWDEDASGAVLVADDGGVLGVVAVHVAPFFEREGAWGRIVALVVAEEARGRGAGARLVAAAEAFAAARGCVRMEVTSNDRRAGAHRFYEGRGYEDQAGRSSRFLRELGR